ncbi:MAG: lmo0937 family membrane protein [Acidobacteria bacterium]|nr:MAG: lmo0937 family membrane protein [Acidobacteriota bacterium]
MPWPLPIVPVLLWLIGLSAHMGGGLIHLLLFVTLIFCVINLATDRD